MLGLVGQALKERAVVMKLQPSGVPKCQRVTTYLDLLDLIGEEAMRRANDSLAKLKKNSRRKPDPKD